MGGRWMRCWRRLRGRSRGLVSRFWGCNWLCHCFLVEEESFWWIADGWVVIRCADET